MVIAGSDKRHSNIQLISELILVANFLFLIWHRTFRMPYFRKITALLVILYGITLLLLHFQDIKYYDYLFLAYILLLGITNKNPETLWYKNEYMFISLLAVLIGIMMANGNIRQWVFYIPIAAILGLISYKVMTTNSFALSTNFFKMNRNILAMLATTFTLLFMVNEKNNDKQVSILISLVLVGINFYSKSRAGLLIAILLAIGSIYSNYKEGDKERRNKVEKIIMLVVLLSVLLIFVYLIMHSRLGNVGLLDKARLGIFKSFFEELTFKKFIFGYQPTAIVSGKYYHLHNSFLQIVADNGMLGVPLISTIGFTLFLNFKNNKLLFYFIVLIVLYSSVEFYIFRRWGDLALYPIVLMSIHTRMTLIRNSYNKVVVTIDI